MITLNITIYNLNEDEDRFKVTAIDSKNGEPVDVTDQYELVSVETPEGQPGFGVFRLAQNSAPSATEGP